MSKMLIFFNTFYKLVFRFFKFIYNNFIWRSFKTPNLVPLRERDQDMATNLIQRFKILDIFTFFFNHFFEKITYCKNVWWQGLKPSPFYALWINLKNQKKNLRGLKFLLYSHALKLFHRSRNWLKCKGLNLSRFFHFFKIFLTKPSCFRK